MNPIILKQKLIDCNYFLNSNCNKGELCGFRHSMDALNNKTICSAWLQEKCTNLHCKERHPQNRSAGPCYFFSQGNCKNGDACPFSHGNNKTSTTIPQTTNHSTPLIQQNKVVNAPTTQKVTPAVNQTTPQIVSSSTKVPKKEPKVIIDSRVNRLLAQPTVKGKKTTSEGKSLVKNGQKTVGIKRKNQEEKKASAKNHGPLDFGIKTLDELRQEKQITVNNSPTDSSPSKTNLVVPTLVQKEEKQEESPIEPQKKTKNLRRTSNFS